MLSNPAGEAVDNSNYTYTPFGDLASGDAAATSYRFTGQYADADLGLQYHRARWLNTSRAGWMSQDPVWDFPNNFGNGYGYVGQNPANRTDSSGLFSSAEMASAAALVSVAVSLSLTTLVSNPNIQSIGIVNASPSGSIGSWVNDSAHGAGEVAIRFREYVKTLGRARPIAPIGKKPDSPKRFVYRALRDDELDTLRERQDLTAKYSAGNLVTIIEHVAVGVLDNKGILDGQVTSDDDHRSPEHRAKRKFSPWISTTQYYSTALLYSTRGGAGPPRPERIAKIDLNQVPCYYDLGLAKTVADMAFMGISNGGDLNILLHGTFDGEIVVFDRIPYNAVISIGTGP